MNQHINRLRENIEPVRNAITAHPLYSAIRTPRDLQLFTEYHVFPVWDFMSLLKALQRSLTCVELPWVPVGSANTRYLINEIVTGEESDVDEHGQRISHFELYLKAMAQLGSDRRPMLQLLEELHVSTIEEILEKSALPEAVKNFLSFTFEVIRRGKPHEMAAVFTFGREDLIPDMFMEMVRGLDKSFPGQLTTFRYYLERHIEVDGDHHSVLAMEMVSELCGDDLVKWEEATAVALKGLEQRLRLWDAVSERLSMFSPKNPQNNFAVSV